MNKKKKKTTACCFIMVVILCLIWLKSQNRNPHSELVLYNIEALASYENGDGYDCIDVGSLDCPNKIKVAYIGPGF